MENALQQAGDVTLVLTAQMEVTSLIAVIQAVHQVNSDAQAANASLQAFIVMVFLVAQMAVMKLAAIDD
eukprot:Em0001g1651a